MPPFALRKVYGNARVSQGEKTSPNLPSTNPIPTAPVTENNKDNTIMLQLLLLACSDDNNQTLPNNFIAEGLTKAKEDAVKELQADLTSTYVDSFNGLINDAALKRKAIRDWKEMIEAEEKNLGELDRVLAYAESTDGSCGDLVKHMAPMCRRFGGPPSRDFRSNIEQVLPGCSSIPKDFVVPVGFVGSARRVPLAVPKARS